MLAGFLLAEAEYARLHQVMNDHRADGDLGAHVEEDAQRAKSKAQAVQKLRGMTQCGGLAGSVRELVAKQPDEGGEQRQYRRQPQAGMPDSGRLAGEVP